MEMHVEENLYLQDEELASIARRLDDFDVVSLDVFDTLLFRLASDPAEVFLHLGEKLDPDDWAGRPHPPEVFRQLRVTAEWEVRKRVAQSGVEEITLGEIYDEMKGILRTPARVMQQEVEVEGQYTWLNPHMLSFLHHCRSLEKKIILLSDFYFSREQLLALLEGCGFDASWVERLLVSSEYKKQKRSGSLFRILEKQLKNVDPARILHIGDDWLSDVAGAHKAGVHGMWYSVVPWARKSYFSMEEAFESDLGVLSSLRSLAIHSVPEPYRGEEMRTYFETGAGVVGPLYSFFAEWVVQRAQEEGLHCVLPLMREGTLLAEVIRRAAQTKGLPLQVKPLYISRRAAMMLGYERVDTQFLEERFAYRNKVILADLFALLYLDISESPFAVRSSQTILEARQKGWWEEVKDYIQKPEILKKIHGKMDEQRALLAEYVLSLTGGQRALTVDLGINGTIQKGLDKAMKEQTQSAPFVHTLLYGGVGHLAKALLEGQSITGWLAYSGYRNSALQAALRGNTPLEAMVLDDVGGTLYYERSAGKVVPVLEETRADPLNRQRKQAIWDGCFCFQRHARWALANRAELMERLLKKQGFLSILARFGLRPLHEEAVWIGKLHFDDHVTYSFDTTLCTPQENDLYRACGTPEKFLARCEEPPNHSRWAHGVVAINNPLYFAEPRKENDPYSTWGRVREYFHCHLGDEMRRAIYGAGLAGQRMALCAWETGLDICCIVDADPQKQGETLFGVPVISPEESVGKVDCYLLSTVNVVLQQEMRQMIQRLYMGRCQPIVVSREEMTI